jgi:amidase
MARIGEVNRAGPKLNAVTALQQARAADAARKAGKAKGILHGIPLIVKDNIATDVKLGMNTTAGSYSLIGSVPPRNSFVAQNLLDAGAIIMGKASMSVWAYYRGTNLTEGWSPRAGFVTSAWYPGASACSSSAGSGVIASIGLAAGTLGSETGESMRGGASLSFHMADQYYL